MNLLLELLKDSKRSDRKLATVLGVSQPTITRKRSRLVNEGLIREFTVIPDFVKMGYEIMAITCFELKVAELEKARKVTMAKPNIIFASSGNGMGKNGVIISLHKNYTDFSNFLRDLDLRDYDTMLISLKEKAVKPLSLKYLAEQEET